MATFPALSPSIRTFTPGDSPSSVIATIDGGELSVRHSNASVGHILRLGFTAVTRANHSAIVNHYSLHGRFQSFDLDAVTIEASDLIFPANYLFIYTTSPDTNETASQIDISVELELIPPYTL